MYVVQAEVVRNTMPEEPNPAVAQDEATRKEETTMRPIGFDEMDQLRFARERAAQLRADWQAANGPGIRAHRRRDGATGLAASVRGYAGRLLIDLRRRVLPAETEPCA